MKKLMRRIGRKIGIGVTALVAVVLPLALIILFNANSVSAVWMDDNWQYRKSIPISAHTSSENNVYISITLAAANSTVTSTLVTNGQLQTDCGDFRFTKQNGEILPYYIASGCNSSST